ncbi:hypothetical protein ACWDTD_14535 [Gordonia sp. NPDC003425]
MRTHLSTAIAITAVAAAAAGTMATTGTANAAVTALKIQSAVGSYGTGCEYTLTATTNHNGNVDFYDGNQAFGRAMSQNYVATITWKPTTTGTHVLGATQGSSTGGGGSAAPPEAQKTVDVKQGLDLGSSCLGL